MKLRFLLVPLSLLTAIPLLSQTPEPPAAAEKEPETELGRKMAKINTAWKKLRRQVSDSTKNEDSLAQVAIVRSNAMESLNEEPVRKADVPAAEQAKFVASYQEKMKEFVTELDRLAVALKAGKNDEAAAIFESLGKLQKADHKEFKRPPKK